MSLDQIAVLLIAIAAVQWPITLVAIYLARRERQTALTFTVGVFVVLSMVSTVGAVLGVVRLLDGQLPAGMLTVMLIGIFVAVGMAQPLWALGVAFGRFK